MTIIVAVSSLFALDQASELAQPTFATRKMPTHDATTALYSITMVKAPNGAATAALYSFTMEKAPYDAVTVALYSITVAKAPPSDPAAALYSITMAKASFIDPTADLYTITMAKAPTSDPAAALYTIAMAKAPYDAATVDILSVIQLSGSPEDASWTEVTRPKRGPAKATHYKSVPYAPPRVPKIAKNGDTLHQWLRCVIVELESRASEEKTTLKYNRFREHPSKDPLVIGVTRAFVVGYKWKTEDCWYQQRRQDKDCIKYGCDYRHKFDDLQEVQKIKSLARRLSARATIIDVTTTAAARTDETSALKPRYKNPRVHSFLATPVYHHIRDYGMTKPPNTIMTIKFDNGTTVDIYYFQHLDLEA